jgi:hypothetical protein
MLKYGIQAMHDETLHLPSSARNRPDPDRLSVRYREFLHAS